LTIGAWIAWDDAVLTEAFPQHSTSYGASGERLPFSTRISGNFSVDQNFVLTNTVSGFAGGSISYVGDRLGGFSGTASALRQIYPAYAQIDLRGRSQI